MDAIRYGQHTSGLNPDPATIPSVALVVLPEGEDRGSFTEYP